MIYTINSKTIDFDLKIDNLVMGFFDGLHIGHWKLFTSIQNEKFSVLTFDFIKPNTKLLFPFADKIIQLEKLKNLEDLIVLDLNKINFTADEFIHLVLKKWSVKNIIVGADFKFGSDQKDVNYLKKFFHVIVIERDDNISSTNIKNLISTGDIESANQMLLNKYYYQSNVIHGMHLGQELGFRTANFLYPNDLVLPHDGVYITSSVLNNIEYQSITFIGIPKTIAGVTKKQFETHLIDYHGNNFYDSTLKVIFHKKIGNVIKYPSVSALKDGIIKQINFTKNFFKNKSNF